MAQLVDGLGRGAPLEEGLRLRLARAGMKTMEREDADAPSRVSLPEDEVQVRHVEVDVGHAQQPLPPGTLRAGQRVQDGGGKILPPPRLIGECRQGDGGRHHNLRSEGRLEGGRERGSYAGIDVADGDHGYDGPLSLSIHGMGRRDSGEEQEPSHHHPLPSGPRRPDRTRPTLRPKETSRARKPSYQTVP